MARPRRVRPINDAKSEVIAENVLKENPEGLPPVDHSSIHKIVTAKHVPEYREIVFINGRDPGYPLDFHYSSKTHPLKIYKLLHGQTYKLPVEVIDHLESRSEPQYAYRKGFDGHPEMYIVSRKFIFQCRNVPRNQHVA
jgi:hypothetical protein